VYFILPSLPLGIALLTRIPLLGPSLNEIFSYQLTAGLFQLNWNNYIMRTMIRMLLAYALSVAFALVYGITAAVSRRAEQVLIPILDVLQSIPVLGYLPGVIIIFLSLFNGNIIGQELASVVLIFTGMVWAVTFGVYGGVKTIPKDISEAAKSFGIRRAKYLRDVILPALYPPFISGSILAWGGGWYFLIACEYLSFANTVYTLPGLGFYIFKAALDGKIAASLFGLLLLIIIVGLINRFVWHPLMEHADKYKYETTAAPGHRRSQSRSARWLSNKLWKFSEGFAKYVEPVVSLEHRYYPLAVRFRHSNLLSHVHLGASWHKYSRVGRLIGTIIGVMLAVLIFETLVPPRFPEALLQFMFRRDLAIIPSYAFGSVARLLIGYSIALAWTLAAGILIARSERLFNIMLPICDIGQSVPALALFPIVVVVVINYFHGSEFGLELASVVLVLTGMQWYLLFNIIGAVRAIPSDVIEASRCFGLRGLGFIRNVVLPAIVPAVILGSIQAWGGGWNATIASEYINTSTQTYHVAGLGYLLDVAVSKGDTPLVLLTIGLMAGIVFLMNRTVWHYSLKRVNKYKFEA
jgi:NitT/TauT family transport system permease protein